MDSRYQTLVSTAKAMNPPQLAAVQIGRAMAERGANEAQIIAVLGEEFLGNMHIKQIAANAIKQYGKGKASANPDKGKHGDVPGGRGGRSAARR